MVGKLVSSAQQLAENPLANFSLSTLTCQRNARFAGNSLFQGLDPNQSTQAPRKSVFPSH